MPKKLLNLWNEHQNYVSSILLRKLSLLKYMISLWYIYKNEMGTKLWDKYFIGFNQHYFIFDAVYIIFTLKINLAGSIAQKLLNLWSEHQTYVSPILLRKLSLLKYMISLWYIYKNEMGTKLWDKYFIGFNQHYFIFDVVYIIAKTLGISKAERHMWCSTLDIWGLLCS